MIYFIALAAIIIDQLTKYLVVSNMNLSASIAVIQDVFHITYIQNTGAAFGIFQDNNSVFVVLVVLFVIGTIFWVTRYKIRDRLTLISFGLIMGGAVGNLIDRLVHHGVIDFFDFRIIKFAIFNVADCAVVIGCSLFFIKTLFFSKEEKNEAV